MKGFKMLRKKERERICGEAIENANAKIKLSELEKMCDDHAAEDPYLKDLKNIIIGTNIKITGVGYNDETDEVLFKLEIAANGTALASLKSIGEELERYF